MGGDKCVAKMQPEAGHTFFSRHQVLQEIVWRAGDVAISNAAAPT